ncbi:MAG: hypothetical protein ACT4O5_09645 [Gammaproteobacteria bacterium]
MANREGKAHFKALRSAITRALNEADPVGLISGGAPLDEYSPEIGTILPRLKEASSEQLLRRIIHEEFARWFGADVAGSEEKYAEVATRIWSQLNEERTV